MDQNKSNLKDLENLMRNAVDKTIKNSHFKTHLNEKLNSHFNPVSPLEPVSPLNPVSIQKNAGKLDANDNKGAMKKRKMLNNQII